MSHSADRRSFLGFFAASGLATTLLPGVLWARWQEEPESPITAAMIREAEEVAGLELSDEEREMMRRGLARNLESYEKLRALEIGNEVSPALRFDPLLPEMAPPEPAGPPSAAPRPWIGAARPGSDADLAFLPVARLAELLRTRRVTSLELTRLYLARLRRYDKRLHCVVTYTQERALAQARLADEEISAGRYRGPLHGIPWGAKDLLATRGTPTTWGAEPYREQMIDTDATVVRRLDEAGAVLIAKLTLGALAMGDRWFGGRTRSPWDPERGSSGSSAGPGAAVAAGCVGFAIGTETRGSIVSPATRNGVTGLRPTFGRVSRHGAMALSWSMDKIGPMCRSAEDCGLVFDAIHGPDGLDASVRSAEFDWPTGGGLDGLRVGYLTSAFEPAERYQNRSTDLDTLRVLREELGVDLLGVALPEFPVDAMGFILSAEAAAAFDSLTRSGRDDELVAQGRGAWPNTFRTARLIPAVEYLQANRARSLYMRAFDEATRHVDVFVTPSYRGGVLGGTNLTGHPCVVVPNGTSEEGMPVSISFVGGLYRDAACLRVADAYQQVTDFHRRRPPLD
jgi:Asp-tRNA(Asn)/Glu-tRNA(Gln) amidotransferase A subunit family amidase